MQKTRNLRQTHNFNWYILLWAVSVIVIVYLFSNWHIDKQYIGIVERKSHQIGAQEPGKVQSMLTDVGEQVKKDQVLAMLDISDLNMQLDQLKRELAAIHDMAGAQRDLYSITAQRLLLQLDNEASDVTDRLSDIEAKNTELAGLNAEIERLKSAEQAGLGHSSELSSLILQRDALASYLNEQAKDLAYKGEKQAKIRKSRKVLETADIDSISHSLIVEQMDYAESLNRDIAATQHRITLQTILAPCDGYITELFAHSGDVVDEFTPVLVVEELKPRYLDVYIPESSNLTPRAGMHVEIFSSRDRAFDTTGTITFVHPGFALASERVSFRGQTFWARKLRVELPDDHQLIPGEVVNVRLLKKENHTALFPFFSASAAESVKGKKKAQPVVKDMLVPDGLWKQSRFEPSGITWQSDTGNFLIVSDDTGIQNTPSDHAPVAFLMDKAGTVQENPVTLSGLREVNDLEAIATRDDNTLYLVSSQNISKKGKRPKSRESIIRITRQGETYTANGQIRLLSLLLETYSRPELIQLGLEKYDDDGKPVLNIEGAAYRDGALYLGLKEPVAKDGAIIWKLDNVDALFQNRRLRPGQLSVYGHVQLGEDSRRAAGFSDLTFDENGVLWALSTIPDAGSDNQTGGLHRIDRYSDGRLTADHVLRYPGMKPEGLCAVSPGHLVIVFDADNDIPAFCSVDTEEL